MIRISNYTHTRARTPTHIPRVHPHTHTHTHTRTHTQHGMGGIWFYYIQRRAKQTDSIQT